MGSSSRVSPNTYASANNSGPGRERSFSTNPSPRPTSPNAYGRSELPRAASYTHFLPIRDPNEFSFTFSEEDLVPSATTWTNYGPHETSEPGTPEDEISHLSYNRSGSIPGDSKITVSRTLLVTEQPDARQSHDPGVSRSPIVSSPRGVRSRSSSFDNFNHKPKVPPPASISPERGQARQAIRPGADRAKQDFDTVNVLGERNTNRNQEYGIIARDVTKSRGTLSRKDSLFGKKSRTSISSFLKFAEPSLSARPSSPIKRPSIPPQRSFSSSTLPSFATSNRVGASAAPLPGLISADKFRVANPSAAKKKDELWSVFRTLDGDFQKFQSKAIALKAMAVRSSLLPFLRTYASHPSNKQLRPEDLDRRTNILNKWWTGMLETLNGRNNQNISGTDRPVILDGISGIMERPEWRTHPSQFCPAAERIRRPGSADSSSKRSSDSSDSSFLLESVHHNVRNTFVQNLFAQMVFVVDRMSLRNAPASLVAFCGKSSAYAFLFCPGVADILVRLWDISGNNIKRLLDQYNTTEDSNFRDLSDLVLPNFPQCLHSLGFTSLKDVVSKLKTKPLLPLGIENIQWHGYWLRRWTGKDSDLFYVFVKYFHVLTADFLPPHAPKRHRVCAPGLILVHAQMLANMDSAIHLQASQLSNDPNNELVSATFDDMLPHDAATPAVPATPANPSRLMAENSLIVLLRDFISDRKPPYPWAYHLFAESFYDVLTTAVRTTSLYNNNACFIICDFLQETLPILIKFERNAVEERPILDWKFWVDVFRHMVRSENTMTEIRLYAFLFTFWTTVSGNHAWKADLCVRLLLEKSHFESRFNHWCPMVRAYYMRLLCWRIARFDGDLSEGEILTLETLMARVQSVWSHWKYLSAKANDEEHVLLSTAPCNPAPGRRLLIIRTDTPPISTFLSLNIMGSSGSSVDSATKKTTTSSHLPSSDGTGINAAQLLEKLFLSLDQNTSPSKKKGLFRNLLGGRPWNGRSESQSPKPSQSPKISSQSSSRESSPSSSKDSSRHTSPERATTSRTSIYEPRPIRPTATGSPKPSIDRRSAKSSTEHPRHTKAFFKFSLEFVDRRPHTIPTDIKLHPPRLPAPAQLLLQTRPTFSADVAPSQPTGPAVSSSRYAGRALAEWSLVVNECQNFFERRRNEGVPCNKMVETPTLGVESFRRPG